MTSGRHEVVDLGGPVHYVEWGGAAELTVVCVHGLGGSHASWKEVAGRLAGRARVLALDLPGFGETPRCGRRATVDGSQRLLSLFLAAVAGGPAVLMGTSLGGAVTAFQAAREPESARALVLGSSYFPGFYGGWRAPAVAASLAAEQVGAGGRALRRRLLRSALAGDGEERSPGEAGDDSGPREGRGRPRLPVSSTEAVASLVALSLAPRRAREAYAAISCPVLVLHGEEDSRVPAAWALHAGRGRPRWRVRTFPGVAHVVRLSDPEWWGADVDAFLTGLASPLTAPDGP